MRVPRLPQHPFTRTDAQRNGIGHSQLARLVRDGVIERVHRNLYWSTSAMDGLPPMAQHARIAMAVTARLPSDYVLAGHSAAALHDLPVPQSARLRPETIRCISTAGNRREIRSGIHVSPGTLDPRDVTTVQGIVCTSVGRTAIDVSRGQTLPRALIALDAARRRGVSVSVLHEALGRVARGHGTAGIGRAVLLSNPLSESAFESLSRGVFVRERLPDAVLQLPVRGASGRGYRADFAWPDALLIGEADGWDKYTSMQVLREEKRREDDLRAQGWRIVRWTMAELLAPGCPPAQAIRKALRQ